MAAKYNIALHEALDEHDPRVFDERRFNTHLTEMDGYFISSL
jgi:hypothetical protein